MAATSTPMSVVFLTIAAWAWRANIGETGRASTDIARSIGLDREAGRASGLSEGGGDLPGLADVGGSVGSSLVASGLGQAIQRSRVSRRVVGNRRGGRRLRAGR
jgi:hypothetical protein